jgi:AcrR family transcriptional regulator
MKEPDAFESHSMAKTSPEIEIPLNDDRPAQLLAIARRLFARKGYANTSLRDIAEEAKITKAALYYHYPNKDALYERVVIESMQGLLETVEAAVTEAHTPTDRVRAFMVSSAKFLEEKRDQWIAGSNAFWQDASGQRRGAAIEQRDAYESLLRRCIEDGVKSGEFRSIDVPLATRMLLSALNQVARWHRPGGRLTVPAVAAQFVDIALFGITKAPSETPRKAVRGAARR